VTRIFDSEFAVKWLEIALYYGGQRLKHRSRGQLPSSTGCPAGRRYPFIDNNRLYYIHIYCSMLRVLDRHPFVSHIYTRSLVKKCWRLNFLSRNFSYCTGYDFALRVHVSIALTCFVFQTYPQTIDIWRQAGRKSRPQRKNMREARLPSIRSWGLRSSGILHSLGW
jgi:hypothetical protein